ncbi:hypothetical protein ACFQX7_28810 [Luedemannella flava]
MTVTAVPGDTRARPRRARVALVAAAAVLVAVAVLALAAKPGAPPRLLSTEAAADTGPAEIVLTFSGRPDASTSHVAVRDADGMVINAGELSADGARLRQPVRAPGPGASRSPSTSRSTTVPSCPAAPRRARSRRRRRPTPPPGNTPTASIRWARSCCCSTPPRWLSSAYC